MSPDWVSAITAILSTIAAFAAAVTAGFSFKLQKNIERGRLNLIKSEMELENVQKYIAIFANIVATSKEEWSAKRNENLKLLSDDLRYTETVIKSVNPSIGEKIEAWKIECDADGNSVPRIVDYILAGHGAIIGERYDEFFKVKSADLRVIQNECFKSMSV